MTLIYSIVIHIFYLLLLPAAMFNNKARLWIRGRTQWRKKMKSWQYSTSPKFWFHAASLGEFEQGLPVIELVKKHVPGCKIILTFYSPSGFEIRKNYIHADYVVYLPLDTDYNARTFVKYAQPDAAFFIKYEFWYFYLRELHRRGVPVYLVSGIFRPEQVFFQWYGSLFRKELGFFRHFFLQDNSSADLLKKTGRHNYSVTGDTRFDRVSQIAAQSRNIDIAREFAEGALCIVAGSTWPPDELLLTDYINACSQNVRFIIAPHETHPGHIEKLSRLITKSHVLYSGASPDSIRGKQVLIIDNIGMLSSLYRYGQIAYIGGGFGRGIHNILEAAVYGIPVIFGPNHTKFREAVQLAEAGGAFPVNSYAGLKHVLDDLTGNTEFRRIAADSARKYILSNTGSAQKITGFVLSDLGFQEEEL